jgi:hypothetical protein
MKRIILCEGKTDAILISYFLQQFNWSYTKKPVINLPVDKNNEVLNWYIHREKPNQELAIWGVGGLEQIPIKLGQVIQRTRREINPINRFSRLVIFFDSDTRNDTECLKLIKSWVAESSLSLVSDLQIGKWLEATTEMTFKTPPESYPVSLLAIVLPPASQGNLEIFLLDCLHKHSNEYRQLVEEARQFIDRLSNQPYLEKQRLRDKAQLGAVLSVMSPDWVFSELDQRLTLIPWEKLQLVYDVYKKLESL